MAILTSDDYPEIRAAIDVSLTKSQPSDDTIAMSIYHAAGEADVLALDPSAESRTGEAAARVHRAAVYFVAARLCPAVVRITSLSVNTRDMSYQKKTFDPNERADELRQMAEQELAQVVQESVSTKASASNYTTNQVIF